MGTLGGSQVCMVPLLDMINHAHPDTANTVLHQDERNGSFGCTAIKNITSGQEVRSSMALLCTCHAAQQVPQKLMQLLQ